MIGAIVDIANMMIIRPAITCSITAVTNAELSVKSRCVNDAFGNADCTQ